MEEVIANILTLAKEDPKMEVPSSIHAKASNVLKQKKSKNRRVFVIDKNEEEVDPTHSSPHLPHHTFLLLLKLHHLHNKHYIYPFHHIYPLNYIYPFKHWHPLHHFHPLHDPQLLHHNSKCRLLMKEET